MKTCFIIAHKYFRGHESYLKHYIDNIQNNYPDSLTIVVDNNSAYKTDIFDQFTDYSNLILLDNNIDSKFEIGAYRVGLNYIIENDLIDSFSYYVFTQDNFILKNKYDFNILKRNGTLALPINSFHYDAECKDVCDHVLNTLGLNDNLDKVNFCWCCSFVINKSKIKHLYEYFKKITVTVRWESCAGERYLARILWELNGRRECGDIDGNISDLAERHYDTWTVNPYSPATSFFVKKVQQKTERTKDSEDPQSVVHIPADVHLKNYNTDGS